MGWFNAELLLGNAQSQTIVDDTFPDSKVHGANMGPTWALSAPDGPMLAQWTLLSGLLPTLYLDLVHRLTSILAWISKHMSRKVWVEIIIYSQTSTVLIGGHFAYTDYLES